MVTITHAAGSYPVLIEAGILGRLPDLAAEYLGERRTALVTDASVGELYGDFLRGTNVAWMARPRICSDTEMRGWRERFEFAAGERFKTRDTWAAITDRLLSAGYGRDSAIIALGGGVVGDLAGFVAATLARGVPFMQVPTTLLAMVDAAIGGKTGVNTRDGKNLVGAFHAPTAVVADPLALGTLSDAELRNGLAEAVKHGLVADADYFAWLATHADQILGRHADALAGLVRRSVEIKASVVMDDEDEHGRRAVLNAGHTVAHALERASGFSIAHGAAVALGLVAEAALAERLGIAQAGLANAVRATLEQFGIVTRLEGPLNAQAVIRAMSGDKKNRGGEVRFALVAAIGRAHHDGDCWTSAAPDGAIVASLSAIGAG